MDETPPPSPAPDAQPPGDTPPDDEERAQAEPGDALTPADRDAQLVARLGHDRDPRALRDKLVEAESLFEAGDSRAASGKLREVLGATPSPELKAEARKGLRYIEPDRRTLLLGALFFALLVVVWVAALRASH